MKRIIFFLVCAILAVSLAQAHPFAPPRLDWLPRIDTIYLTQVVSNDGKSNGVDTGKIAFQVTEVLRGKTSQGLILNAYEDPSFNKSTKWILLHNPSGFKDCVGWAMEGDCEWLPIQVTGEGDKQTAQWLGSLDIIREYIKTHPYKH